MEKGWPGLPFTPISKFYAHRFGGKVYKIPLAVADDCPNRRGLKGMQTCVFCDEWGSAARSEAFELDLETQLLKYRDVIQKRFKAENFLAYFQAYTSTFLKLNSLREHIDVALKYDWIKGFVVGTRPDCLSKAVFDMWNEYCEKTFVAVELGVQTFDNEQLIFMRRGHTAEDSIKAIHKIAAETSVNLGIHLIFGNPGETDEQIVATAKQCNQLPIHNIKLHHLHVLKNTPLEELFHKGEFTPIDFATYAHRVALFLDHLSPHIYVHRVAAYSSRWDQLVAPEWTKDKMRTHQGIVDWMREGNHTQGKYAPSSTI